MRRSATLAARWLASCLGGAGPGASAQQRFRPPGQAPAPAGWAREAGVELRGLRLGRRGAARRLAGRRRPLILDTPRPTDRAQVEQALGERLQGGRNPDPRRRWSAGFRQPRRRRWAGAWSATTRTAAKPTCAGCSRRSDAGMPACRRRVAGAAPRRRPALSSRRTGAVRRLLADYPPGALALGQRRPAHRLLDPRGAIADAQTGAIDELLRVASGTAGRWRCGSTTAIRKR